MQAIKDGDDFGPQTNYRNKSQWDWNYLEGLMSSHQYQAQHSSPRETSYMNLPVAATTTINSDDMSEKMVEMDLIVTSGSNNINMDLLKQELNESSPHSIHQELQGQSSSNNVPSYMAPTQSAKAKLRNNGTHMQRGSYTPQWNPTIKKGYDSSSSGGGTTTTYQFPRSPSPKHHAMRCRRSPSPGGSPRGDDWALSSSVNDWRHDFN